MDKQPDIEAVRTILNLQAGALHEDVRHAYRDIVKVWHLDRFAHDPRLQAKASERLKAINEAYHTLLQYLDSTFQDSVRSHATASPHSYKTHSNSTQEVRNV